MENDARATSWSLSLKKLSSGSIKIAQRGISGNTPDMHIDAGITQCFGVTFCRTLIIVAAVLFQPYEKGAPRFQLTENSADKNIPDDKGRPRSA